MGACICPGVESRCYGGHGYPCIGSRDHRKKVHLIFPSASGNCSIKGGRPSAGACSHEGVSNTAPVQSQHNLERLCTPLPAPLSLTG